MMKKTLLSISMALALSACGSDKAVDTVKNFPYNADVGGMAIGKLMDARDLCAKQHWSSVEIPNSDATRVEFRCELKGASDYFAEEGKERLAEYDARQSTGGGGQNYAQGRLETARENRVLLQSVIENPELHPRVAEIRASIEEFEAAAEDPDISRSRQAGLRNALNNRRRQLENVLANGSDDARKQLERLEKSMPALEEQARMEAERNEERLASAAQRRDNIIDNYTVSSAEEVITWRVEDNKVHLEKGHILMNRESGEALEWDYYILRNVLGVIHDFEVNGDGDGSLQQAIEARRDNRGFGIRYL